MQATWRSNQAPPRSATLKYLDTVQCAGGCRRGSPETHQSRRTPAKIPTGVLSDSSQLNTAVQRHSCCLFAIPKPTPGPQTTTLPSIPTSPLRHRAPPLPPPSPLPSSNPPPQSPINYSPRSPPPPDSPPPPPPPHPSPAPAQSQAAQ